MSLRRGPKPLCIMLCQVLGLAPTLSGAAEWSAEPSVAVKTVYNTNFDLTTDPHPTVWGVILSPAVKLNGESEALKVTGGANVDLNHYSQKGLNTPDGALTLRSDYRAERDVLGLNVQLIRSNTLASELATTGVVLAYTPLNQLIINPSWSRSLTERTKLVASYGFTGDNYLDNASTGLIDWRDQIASVGLQFALSELSVVTFTAYYDMYATNPSSFRAETTGIQAGITHDFSETTRAALVFGPRYTHGTTSSQTSVCNAPIILGVCTGTATTLTSNVTTDSSGYTLTAKIDKRWETAAVSGQLAREINPSGVGSLVQTDLLRFALTSQLSPTVTGHFDAGFYQSQYVGGVIEPNKGHYFRLTPYMSWNLSSSWVLDAGYSYAKQKYNSQPAAATANVVFVALSYTWQKITVSR